MGSLSSKGSLSVEEGGQSLRKAQLAVAGFEDGRGQKPKNVGSP